MRTPENRLPAPNAPGSRLLIILAAVFAASALPAQETKSAEAAQACIEDAQRICLSNSRFQVRTSYQTAEGEAGPGNAVRLTPDTGYFWFFNDSNVEVVVKVLNGCAVNNRYWVFAGGLTNVRVVTTVVDTQTGQVKVYTNQLNEAFQPIQDVTAFATCP